MSELNVLVFAASNCLRSEVEAVPSVSSRKRPREMASVGCLSDLRL